jgi:hypothetical protein
MLVETIRSVRLAKLELHKFIAYRSKLMATPTCTSKHPLNGRIIGAMEQFGVGIT